MSNQFIQRNRLRQKQIWRIFSSTGWSFQTRWSNNTSYFYICYNLKSRSDLDWIILYNIGRPTKQTYRVLSYNMWKKVNGVYLDIKIKLIIKKECFRICTWSPTTNESFHTGSIEFWNPLTNESFELSLIYIRKSPQQDAFKMYGKMVSTRDNSGE